MKLVLFDLDDTLLAGDTEGEWVKFMIDSGMVRDESFLEKMAIFTGNYRNGRLDIFEYSNFLLGPLSGINELDLNQKVQEFSKKVVEKLSDATTYNLLDRHSSDERVITSGTLSFLVKEIANELGVESCFGTNAEIINGSYTGKVSGHPNFSEEKVRKINHGKGKKFF
jgi:Haloacid Dehalogenase superfamily, subfamily IB, phosphoserine phosphatase-like